MLKKGDFVEVEFTGKLEDGTVFDSNIEKDLTKINEGREKKIIPKPFVFAIGQDMFLKGVDDFLTGKNIGEYTIALPPERAFGKRNPQLIQMIPSKHFRQHNLNPVPGISFNFDGRIGKVLTASGGRIMVDFNNPLAGKDVTYHINVLRAVEDINERTKSLIDFIFRKSFEFEVKDKTLTIKTEKGMKEFIELFKDKFKDVLGLDLKVNEIEKEKPKEDLKEEEKKKDANSKESDNN